MHLSFTVILYKYVSSDRLDALQRRALRFTQPDALNDPREVLIRFAKDYDAGAMRKVESGLGQAQFLKNAIRTNGLEEVLRFAVSHIRQETYTQIVAEATKVPVESREEWLVNSILYAHGTQILYERTVDILNFDTWRSVPVGVLSLSETHSSPLMWSHYASAHAGFVLGFESSAAIFTSTAFGRRESVKPVIYVDAPVTISAIDVGQVFERFFVKSHHWAYEKEWRVLKKLHEANHVIDTIPFPIHLYRFPSHALHEVILGFRISETLELQLKELLADPILAHVRIYKMQPDIDGYGFERRDLA